MFKAEFFYSSQGERKEQLDRFQTVDTGQCVIFMLTDGYDFCSAKPHYVEWLCEQLEGLKDSKLNCTAACLGIEKLLKQTNGSPGKASVVFVVSDNGSYCFTSLGDTRIYWLSEGRRTEDHSLAQLAVDRGQCPPDKMRFHPHRHTLTRHIGAGLKYHPQWICRAVSKNEKIVICTDGFWCQLSDDEIYKITTHTDLKQLLNNVLALPQEDNLSVVLLYMN